MSAVASLPGQVHVSNGAGPVILHLRDNSQSSVASVYCDAATFKGERTDAAASASDYTGSAAVSKEHHQSFLQSTKEIDMSDVLKRPSPSLIAGQHEVQDDEDDDDDCEIDRDEEIKAPSAEEQQVENLESTHKNLPDAFAEWKQAGGTLMQGETQRAFAPNREEDDEP